MSRWISATAAKPASIDSVFSARISTKVPKKGRILAKEVLFAREDGFISMNDPSDTVADVHAGKRCSADVLDILVHFDRVVRTFSHELFPPRWKADFRAI